MFVLLQRLFTVLAQMEELTVLFNSGMAMPLRNKHQAVTWVTHPEDGETHEFRGVYGEVMALSGVILALRNQRWSCIDKRGERYWDWYWRAHGTLEAYFDACLVAHRSYC